MKTSAIFPNESFMKEQLGNPRQVPAAAEAGAASDSGERSKASRFRENDPLMIQARWGWLGEAGEGNE